MKLAIFGLVLVFSLSCSNKQKGDITFNQDTVNQIKITNDETGHDTLINSKDDIYSLISTLNQNRRELAKFFCTNTIELYRETDTIVLGYNYNFFKLNGVSYKLKNPLKLHGVFNTPEIKD